MLDSPGAERLIQGGPAEGFLMGSEECQDKGRSEPLGCEQSPSSCDRRGKDDVGEVHSHERSITVTDREVEAVGMMKTMRDGQTS